MSPREAASCKVFMGNAVPLVKCDFDNSGTITRVNYDAFAQTRQPDEFFTQGLVDIQVNGFAGIDFNNAGLTAVQMDHALAHLAASGRPGRGGRRRPRQRAGRWSSPDPPEQSSR